MLVKATAAIRPSRTATIIVTAAIPRMRSGVVRQRNHPATADIRCREGPAGEPNAITGTSLTGAIPLIDVTPLLCAPGAALDPAAFPGKPGPLAIPNTNRVANLHLSMLHAAGVDNATLGDSTAFSRSFKKRTLL